MISSIENVDGLTVLCFQHRMDNVMNKLMDNLWKTTSRFPQVTALGFHSLPLTLSQRYPHSKPTAHNFSIGNNHKFFLFFYFST